MEKIIKKYINNWLVIIVTVLIVVIVLGLLLIKPRVERESRAVKELKSNLAALEQQDANLIRLKNDYQSVESEADEFFKILPRQEEVIDFIEQLDIIASRAGLNQTSSVAEAMEQDNNLLYLPVAITLEGSVNDFGTYLSLYDQLAYQSSIESINYSKAFDRDKMSARLEINLYIRKD